jgi:hypothetical protein
VKLLAGSFLLVMGLGLSPVFVVALAQSPRSIRTAPTGAPPAPGSMIITGLDPLFPDVPPGGFQDHFPRGQCTWWVAFNVPVTWGGNAGDWLVNASRRGRGMTDQPLLHSIVVYAPSRFYSGYGHVAIVLAVSRGWFLVSEMNYADGGRGTGVVDQRWSRWPDPLVEGFVLPA